MTANREKEAKLSAEQLREIVHYDPVIGRMIWQTSRRIVGTITKKGYRATKIGGLYFLVHRLVWLYTHGRWPADQIDHINGDPADNRICNLREATNGQNSANRRALRGRALKGIWFDARRNHWRATVCRSGRLIHIGVFASAEEAHSAYVIRAREVHGEFARVA